MHMLYDGRGQIDTAKDLSKNIKNEILEIWNNRAEDAKGIMVNNSIFKLLKEKDEYYKNSVAEQLVDHYNLHGKDFLDDYAKENIFKIAEKESEFLHKIDNKIGHKTELSQNQHLTLKGISIILINFRMKSFSYISFSQARPPNSTIQYHFQFILTNYCVMPCKRSNAYIGGDISAITFFFCFFLFKPFLS